MQPGQSVDHALALSRKQLEQTLDENMYRMILCSDTYWNDEPMFTYYVKSSTKVKLAAAASSNLPIGCGASAGPLQVG